jgi:hypothetical protein
VNIDTLEVHFPFDVHVRIVCLFAVVIRSHMNCRLNRITTKWTVMIL